MQSTQLTPHHIALASLVLLAHYVWLRYLDDAMRIIVTRAESKQMTLVFLPGTEPDAPKSALAIKQAELSPSLATTQSESQSGSNAIRQPVTQQESPSNEPAGPISQKTDIETEAIADEAMANDRPAVDWQVESEQASRSFVQRRLAEKAATPRAMGSRKAAVESKKSKSDSFEWRPQEKRAGFTGGLPYVRLGKNCMLVLVFIGCGFGGSPEANAANGDLFKDMRDEESIDAQDFQGEPAGDVSSAADVPQAP
ncbi:MAG: hypothetical protein QM808_13720 [Steroidobacteraceae bacterium]